VCSRSIFATPVEPQLVHSASRVKLSPTLSSLCVCWYNTLRCGGDLWGSVAARCSQNKLRTQPRSSNRAASRRCLRETGSGARLTGCTMLGVGIVPDGVDQPQASTRGSASDGWVEVCKRKPTGKVFPPGNRDLVCHVSHSPFPFEPFRRCIFTRWLA